MKFGSGREGAIAALAIDPPFKNAAAAATPKRAAIHGIAIPQIAPVDSPLLLFLITGVIIELFLLDAGVVGIVVFWLIEELCEGDSSILAFSSNPSSPISSSSVVSSNERSLILSSFLQESHLLNIPFDIRLILRLL